MALQRMFDYPTDALALRLNALNVGEIRVTSDGSGGFLVTVDGHAATFSTEAEATTFLDLWTFRAEDAR